MAKKQSEQIAELKIEVAFLQEQVWYTQEAMRRMMLALSNHLAPAGAEAVVDLMSEWTQIIHNINKDYKPETKDVDSREL